MVSQISAGDTISLIRFLILWSLNKIKGFLSCFRPFSPYFPFLSVFLTRLSTRGTFIIFLCSLLSSSSFLFSLFSFWPLVLLPLVHSKKKNKKIHSTMQPSWDLKQFPFPPSVMRFLSSFRRSEICMLHANSCICQNVTFLNIHLMISYFYMGFFTFNARAKSLCRL